MTSRSIAELRTAAAAAFDAYDVARVFVTTMDFECTTNDYEPPYSVVTYFHLSGRQVSEDEIEVRARYVVEARQSREDPRGAAGDPESDQTGQDRDAPGPLIWRAVVEYASSLVAENESSVLNEEELAAFATIHGSQLLHPYVRETVQSMTGRSPFPAYSLGLLMPLSDFPDDQMIEVEDLLYEPVDFEGIP